MSVANAKLFCFPKKEHLRSPGDIGRLMAEGRRVSCKGAKLFFSKNQLTYNRIAFTFPRKYGNAVQRNRSKRYGREAWRLHRHIWKQGYDLVLLVYPGKDSFLERQAQLHTLAGQADLLCGPSDIVC